MERDKSYTKDKSMSADQALLEYGRHCLRLLEAKRADEVLKVTGLAVRLSDRKAQADLLTLCYKRPVAIPVDLRCQPSADSDDDDVSAADSSGSELLPKDTGPAKVAAKPGRVSTRDGEDSSARARRMLGMPAQTEHPIVSTIRKKQPGVEAGEYEVGTSSGQPSGQSESHRLREKMAQLAEELRRATEKEERLKKAEAAAAAKAERAAKAAEAAAAKAAEDRARNSKRDNKRKVETLRPTDAAAPIPYNILYVRRSRLETVIHQTVPFNDGTDEGTAVYGMESDGEEERYSDADVRRFAEESQEAAYKGDPLLPILSLPLTTVEEANGAGRRLVKVHRQVANILALHKGKKKAHAQGWAVLDSGAERTVLKTIHESAHFVHDPTRSMSLLPFGSATAMQAEAVGPGISRGLQRTGAKFDLGAEHVQSHARSRSLVYQRGSKYHAPAPPGANHRSDARQPVSPVFTGPGAVGAVPQGRGACVRSKNGCAVSQDGCPTDTCPGGHRRATRGGPR
jgi:hypothetical protein